MTGHAHLAIRYSQNGSYSGVGFASSVEECLASALADGYRLATVGPRSKGHPRFFAHDGTSWCEVGADEFEERRGLDGPPTLLRWVA